MVMACNLRKEPKIQEEIKRLKEIMYQDILLDPNDIIQRYIEIAFLDESEMDGKAVKMSDSLKALEWLDERLKDKNELNDMGNDGFLEALNASAKEDWEDEEE